ncbi:hypothetical protein [uncultured Cellulomonas sp.]|uniref:hypothetical protein n=1 Tax=uncultured Cellulomonas sp. TaxID=189682 RepID=UPI0026110040|nr:hypothetical protein [uncultured Cellulomonas sp.]
MTFASTPEPVVSGVPYPVSAVDGEPVRDLTDLLGTVSIVIDKNGTPYVIEGEGTDRDGVVRLHEKSGKGGKDLRVWNIYPGLDGGFQAETTI